MQPGIVSDLVKTQYGFHIIKVTDQRAPAQRPFEEVQQQIIEQLKTERAQTQASNLADRIAAEVRNPGDLERVAKANGLAVQESDFFLPQEPITGLGPAAEAAAEAFRLKDGEVSDAVRTPQGFAVLALSGRQDAHIPKLEDVKDRAREAVVRAKALDVARARARDLLPRLKNAADFEAEAKAAGLEVQASADFVARGGALPALGVSPQADAAAFALRPGQVSDLVSTEAAVAVLKVVDRQDVTEDQLKEARTALREEILNERRGRFFSSYMAKAKGRMKITINREALQRIAA